MPLKCMNNYISIKVALDNLLSHPMLKDVTFERAVNHTVTFIQLVGMPRIFLEKTAVIDIDDWRGLLPCDIYEILQVRTTAECNHRHKIFRYSTDSFHMSKDHHRSYDLTYKTQGNVIFTSMKKGKIEVAYYAFATDSEGYPLIPDNGSFLRALELYIKKYYFGILFDQGKITPQIYNQTLQDYTWAVGQAQSDLVNLTVDQMQSLTNSLNTLIPRVNEHSKAFVNNGTMEKLRVV